MTAHSSPRRAFGERLYFWLVATLLIVPGFSHAQTVQPTPTLDPLAGVPVHVLDQVQVTIGTHVVTLNRIVPPPLPTPTPDASSNSSTRSTSSRPAANAKKSGKPTTRTKKITHSAQDATPSDGGGDGGSQSPPRCSSSRPRCTTTSSPG